MNRTTKDQRSREPLPADLPLPPANRTALPGLSQPNPVEFQAQSMERIHQDHGNRVQQMEEEEQSLFARILGGDRGLGRVMQEQRVEEVREWHRYRSDLIKLAADTKLEMCHEACLKMARELKVGNRQEFAAFVTAKEEELRQVISRRVETFLHEMDHAYTLAEKYEHRPLLAERQMLNIERTVTGYFDFIEGLTSNFIAIARERVNEYRITD